MKEYEYSFKVDDIRPYIKYCEEHDYKLIEDTKQSRLLYRHENKTLARITTKESNGTITKELDFKDDVLSDEVLIERRESKAISFEDDKAVVSILDFLGYWKDTLLIRRRIVYKKNNVTFEIDNYESPEKSLVVAIEGIKEEVDKVYNDVRKYVDNNHEV